MTGTTTITKVGHRYPRMLVLVAALALTASLLVASTAKPSHASLFYTVNDTGDESDANPGDGLCNADPSAPILKCTLRAAIQESNANAVSPEFVFFKIPGDGVHTISPNSELPRIADTVTIDGYSQPDSSPNTLARGTNARLLIQLNGTNAGEFTDGLDVDAPNSVVKGLVINRFDGEGVDLLQQGDGSKVEGNFIGTDPSGTVAKGNTFSGVEVFFESNDDTVGGNTPAARNLISGNDDLGVNIFSAAGTGVFGNLIGTSKDGIGRLGNGEQGVDVFDGSNNSIGDGTAAGANTIAFNGLQGVRVRVPSSGVAVGDHISRNSIFSNGRLGIDLGLGGANTNDQGDADTGANNLQNKPVVTSAKSGRGTTIKGNLNSNPNTIFTIEFFASPGGENEGKTFIGQRSVITDGSGSAPFSFRFQKQLVVGRNVTATATNGSTNDTSEFSAPKAVVAG